jgi:ADP-ribose pyrophosphatase
MTEPIDSIDPTDPVHPFDPVDPVDPVDPTMRPAGAPFGDDPLEEHVIGSRLIHRGRYMEFRVDTIERADGSRGTRDVVGHPGAVAVLALDDDGRLLLVRQWRIPARRALLEIPAGTLDVHEGVTEDPDGAARRELEEETGHRATTWRKLATFWTAPGFASELMHLYLATGIAGAEGDDRLAPDEDEFLELSHLAIDEALRQVERGEICDAKSILGILWLDRLRVAGELPGVAGELPGGAAVGDAPATGDASEPSPAAPPTPGADAVSIGYAFSVWQFALANASLVRRQRSARILGALLAVFAVAYLAASQDVGGAVISALFAASMLSGAFVVPFVWFSFRGKGDLFANTTVTIDDAGVTSSWPIGGGTITWSGIEKIDGDRSWLFVKALGGAAMPIPRRAIAPEELGRFERLALRHGLTLDGHRVDPPGR